MAGTIRVTTEMLLKKQEEWMRELEQAYRLGEEAAGELQAVDGCFQAKRLAGWKEKTQRWSDEWEEVCRQAQGHLEKLTTMALIYDTAERSNQNVCRDDRNSISGGS